VWVVDQTEDNDHKKFYCASHGIGYQVIEDTELQGWPIRRSDVLEKPSGRKKVIVTGCFDWVSFRTYTLLREVSQLGDLYVAVGA